MKKFKLFWLALYFLIPAIPIGLIFNSPFSQFGDPLYNLSVVSGALAFTWLVNQLIISARPKFIERHFGMDRVYRFHTWMALVSLGLVILHRQAKLALTGFTPTPALIAAILFIFAVLFAVVFLADTRLRNLKFVRDLIAFADQKLGLGFNRVVLFHNLTVAASLLMALHVLRTSTAQVYRPVQIFYVLYFALGLAFYLYHKVIKPWRLARHPYRVDTVVQELSNINTLRLTPPDGKSVFNYRPGQFAFITPLGGAVAREEHPFTISSSPVDQTNITFTIKDLGDFTANIGNIRPGSSVRVDAPYGVFSYQNNTPGQPLGLIAGGIGITPMLSKLRTLRETEPQREVTLLWGVNQSEELFCQDELEAIRAEMLNFTWHPVVAFDETWPGEKGYIDREKLQRLLLDGDTDGKRDIYLCGPKVMMALVSKHLKSLGMAKSRIYAERFSF